MTTTKIKVAVLGGGISSLAAAFELTDPRHGGRYDITLYQLGWRLGGKCASGREVADGWRTKEHGPHVLFGFYDNAFAVLREAYTALRADTHRRFASFDDAVTAVNDLVAMEEIGGEWLPWVCHLPTYPGQPGVNPPTDLEIFNRVSDWLIRVTRQMGILAADAEKMVERLQLAQALAERVAPDGYQSQYYDKLVTTFASYHAVVVQYHSQVILSTRSLRHLWILIDLASAIIAGALADRVLFCPAKSDIARVNELDFRAWICKNGASAHTADSAVVRAIYDTVFAYPEGDTTRPGNLEAGSVYLAMKASVGYRGAPLWKMKSGTGDVTAAPLYEALVKRGVKFEFFCRVDAIVPSKRGSAIESILLGRQVTLNCGSYQPFLDLNGLKVWPDRPLYDQIVEGEASELEKRGIDLESFWTPWPDTRPPLELSRSAGDFDLVLLGIPVEALKVIAPKALPSSWESLFNVNSVATETVHVWLTKTTTDAGWDATDDPVVTSFDSTSIDTWFDATSNLNYEQWGQRPSQAAIFCGPMAAATPPSHGEHDYPSYMDARVKAEGLQFLKHRAEHLWPNLYRSSKFDWDSIVDPEKRSGEQRFDAQYWRARVNPTDLYVQSAVGTGKYRLSSHSVDFDNLYYCGDWTDYGLNLGCFEGAVISGLKAANAITGQPRTILRDPYASCDRFRIASRSYPAFIEYPGDQTCPAPVDFDNATMWTFLLRADLGALRTLTRGVFAYATGGSVTFEPLFPWITMSVCDFPDCYPTGDKSKGTSAERELNFGIPGWYTCNDGASDRGFAMFFPFLFLDNIPALVTGREEFGYFKQGGWLEVVDPYGSPQFRCDIFGARYLLPSTKWARTRLMTLTPTAMPPTVAPTESSDNASLVIHRFLDSLHLSSAERTDLLSHYQYLDQMLLGGQKQIFLKQFRDIQNGHLACYQAVTLTRCSVHGLHEIGCTPWLDMTLEDLESTPVANALGVASATRLMGIRVCMDMRLEPGWALWESP